MHKLLKPLTDREPILNCRQYQNTYPLKNEYVVGVVKEVDEISCQVELIEQNAIKAMIATTEVQISRSKSVKQQLKVGKTYILNVLRVDEEKQFIDLSKKHVNQEEIEQCKQKHKKSKKINSIIRNVAELCKIDIEDIQKVIVWPLYQKQKHPLEAFIESIQNPNEIFGKLDIPNDVLSCLINEINRRLKTPPVRIKAEFELTCFEQEGINSIKKAFKAGEFVNTMNAKFKIISPPIYMCEIVSDEKDKAINCINKILLKIEKEISSENGEFILKSKAKVCEENKYDVINTRNNIKSDESDEDNNYFEKNLQEKENFLEINEKDNNRINTNQYSDDDDF